jgi:pyruvate dehydrogenase E1 component alpha subunit
MSKKVVSAVSPQGGSLKKKSDDGGSAGSAGSTLKSIRSAPSAGGKGKSGVAADPAMWISVYKEMLFYRRFEERVLKAYQAGKFAGFCHLHIGQEAVCVGVQRALAPTDYMISGYRSHTQAIAKGVSPEAVMAELFGKYDGSVKGKGGSMHMFSKEHRFLGGHGIVGGQTPLAAGVAFAIKYEEKQEIIVCYLGDAATNQGQFFEAMNMAATWKLPVLYVIENNRYGMGTDIKRTTSVDHLWKRALAFDMEHSQVDGMDVVQVYDHVKPLAESMRKSHRPHLLEVITYRYRGHSVSDPATYRTKEEVQEWISRDPLTLLGAALTGAKVATEAEFQTWDEEARSRLEGVEAFADASPFPPDSEAFTDVLAETVTPRRS